MGRTIVLAAAFFGACVSPLRMPEEGTAARANAEHADTPPGVVDLDAYRSDSGLVINWGAGEVDRFDALVVVGNWGRFSNLPEEGDYDGPYRCLIDPGEECLHRSIPWFVEAQDGLFVWLYPDEKWPEAYAARGIRIDSEPYFDAASSAGSVSIPADQLPEEVMVGYYRLEEDWVRLQVAEPVSGPGDCNLSEPALPACGLPVSEAVSEPDDCSCDWMCDACGDCCSAATCEEQCRSDELGAWITCGGSFHSCDGECDDLLDEGEDGSCR